MAKLPDPVLEEHGGITVVRDDLLPGGTKRRAIASILDADHHEYIYPSPVFGFAQVAIAYAAQDHGVRATIFCARRGSWAPLTRRAAAAGATIHEVDPGYLNVVRARARKYCAEDPGRLLLPFGLNDPRVIEALAEVARGLPVQPREVWSVAGSGVLTRALQMAWPKARFVAVRIGSEPDAGRAEVIEAPERYEQDALEPPPFPSCANYDAKAWRFIRAAASPGALFWNVAA
jgi:hypothetical protein